MQCRQSTGVKACGESLGPTQLWQQSCGFSLVIWTMSLACLACCSCERNPPALMSRTATGITDKKICYCLEFKTCFALCRDPPASSEKPSVPSSPPSSTPADAAHAEFPQHHRQPPADTSALPPIHSSQVHTGGEQGQVKLPPHLKISFAGHPLIACRLCARS